MNGNYDIHDSWYATPAAAAAPDREKTAVKAYRKTGRKLRKGRVITLIVLLLLLAVAVYFAATTTDKPANTFNFHWGNNGEEGGWSSGDGTGPAGGDASNTEEYPETFNDFFNTYFTDTPGVDIEKFGEKVEFSVNPEESSGEELSLKELYDKCSKSVVGIKAFTDSDENGYSWGTGIIASPDGIIITNTHVIEECNKAKVILYNDAEFPAKLIGYNDLTDIALLKIDADGLPAAEFGKSDGISVGDRVAAIGNPLGEKFRATLSDGIVSAISRELAYNGATLTLIQTNTALNEGNSGGPLFNMYGQVVGVTNMKMMSLYSSIEGIGFAIPASTVAETVDGIVNGSAAFGITCGGIPEDVSGHYSIPSGVYVTFVQPKSDAHEKGIREGDIITAVNGKPVKNTDDVVKQKEGLKPGDTVTLTVWREGKTFDAEIILGNQNDFN